MAVTSTTTSVSYSGNGSTTAFPIPFRFIEASHIVASKTAADGEVTPLSFNVHYTITGTGEEGGGTLTTVSAPISGETLTIARATPLLQPTVLSVAGNFFPKTHEKVFDRVVMIAQEQAANAVDLLSQIQALAGTGGNGGGLSDQLLDLADNPAAQPATSGRIRVRSIGGRLQVSQAGRSFEDIVKVFDVKAFGAKGIGPSFDDVGAWRAAYAAARAAGGGVVHGSMPPSGAYYFGDTFVAGQMFIDPADVKYVAGGAWDPWAAASYDDVKHTAYYSEPVVSFSADPGVEIRAMFSDKAIFVYGISGGDVPGSASGFIHGLTLVGPGGYSGTAAVFPPGQDSVSGTNVGLCILGAQVDVAGVTVRECDRGVVGFDSEWAVLRKVQTKRTNKGFELIQFNAGEMVNCRADYAQSFGVVVTGGGFSVWGFATEQAKCGIWIPFADNAFVNGRYLENVGGAYNDYSIRFGDPAAAGTTQVVHTTLMNTYGVSEHGQALYLHASQITGINVRHYPGPNSSKTLLHDIYSRIDTINCSLPIDPASMGEVRPLSDAASSTGGGVLTAGVQSIKGVKNFVDNIITQYARLDDIVNMTTGRVLNLRGGDVDGASAVGTAIGASVTLATAGAKAVRFMNGMDTSPHELAHIDKDGKLNFNSYTDSSGTPGNATANTVTGRSAIGTSATAITITNSCVTAQSIIDLVLEDLDATALRLKVVPAAGSFVVTANAAATGTTRFRWKVTN